MYKKKFNVIITNLVVIPLFNFMVKTHIMLVTVSNFIVTVVPRDLAKPVL